MKVFTFLLLFIPFCAVSQNIDNSDTLTTSEHLLKSAKHSRTATIDGSIAATALLFGNMYFRLYVDENETTYLRAAVTGFSVGLVFGYLSLRNKLRAADELELAASKL